MSQGGNMERRDVGDSAGVNSKLSDMQNAIESLTHSVNSVATKQQVRVPTADCLHNLTKVIFVWGALFDLPFSLPS